MRKPLTITKAYTCHYRDNDSRKAYVEWSNGARTEGNAELYHGITVPVGSHMGALFDRALRDGLTIGKEAW